jgi:hypothetical protein
VTAITGYPHLTRKCRHGTNIGKETGQHNANQNKKT